MKVSKAPVFRSGRCYAYLSLTDFGLTCHLNKHDKVQKPASSFFPLLTTLSRYFLCPGLFPWVLMEMTSIDRALTVSFSWLATVHRAFTAPTQPSDSPMLVPLWAQSELKPTNFWRAGPASQAVAVCRVNAYSLWLWAAIQSYPETPYLETGLLRKQAFSLALSS